MKRLVFPLALLLFFPSSSWTAPDIAPVEDIATAGMTDAGVGKAEIATIGSLLATPSPWIGGARASAHSKHLYNLGYLIMKCSSVNMIFGLGLTRAQVGRLSEMARVIDALSPPPALDVTGTSVFAGVHDGFKRLENALRLQTKIPDSFRLELMKLREEEARQLRAGLRYTTTPVPFSCARCHRSPEVQKYGWPWIDTIAKLPGIQKEKAVSHTIAPFGLFSFLAIWYYSFEIDILLTGAQKAAVSDFTCCLLPPRDFADPIRIGQAREGEWETKTLEKIRGANRFSLPFVRYGIKSFMERKEKAIRPGTSASQLAEIDKEIDDLIKKTRELSEVDFTLQKHELAAVLTRRISSPGSEAQKRFKTAMFLLMPGSSLVYRGMPGGGSSEAD